MDKREIPRDRFGRKIQMILEQIHEFQELSLNVRNVTKLKNLFHGNLKQPGET